MKAQNETNGTLYLKSTEALLLPRAYCRRTDWQWRRSDCRCVDDPRLAPQLSCSWLVDREGTCASASAADGTDTCTVTGRARERRSGSQRRTDIQVYSMRSGVAPLSIGGVVATL